MMGKKKYTLIIERDEEGWLVSEVVELSGCHTQAKTMDQLLERTKEAIQAYLQEEKPSSEMVYEFVGVQHVEV
jgi:predicted RNase H-like HicB family nuclease